MTTDSTIILLKILLASFIATSMLGQTAYAKVHNDKFSWQYVYAQKGIKIFLDTAEVKKSNRNKNNETRYVDALTIKRFYKPIQIYKNQEVYRFDEQVIVDCQDKLSKVYIRIFYNENDDFIEIEPLVDNIYDMSLNLPKNAMDEQIMDAVCDHYSSLK